LDKRSSKTQNLSKIFKILNGIKLLTQQKMSSPHFEKAQNSLKKKIKKVRQNPTKAKKSV
jgi:hypothetical protein